MTVIFQGNGNAVRDQLYRALNIPDIFTFIGVLDNIRTSLIDGCLDAAYIIFGEVRFPSFLGYKFSDFFKTGISPRKNHRGHESAPAKLETPNRGNVVIIDLEETGKTRQIERGEDLRFEIGKNGFSPVEPPTSFLRRDQYPQSGTGDEINITEIEHNVVSFPVQDFFDGIRKSR
jgi:hypothetical protein